jgi:hypothetical protein
MCPTTASSSSTTATCKKAIENEVIIENLPRKRLARRDETPDITDTGSVDSENITDKNEWKDFYDPPPMVDQQTILSFGLILFLLAMVWPPLVLIFSYVCSKLIPYSFRVNDEGSKRRQLFADFAQTEDLHPRFKEIPENICYEESYWVNQR